MSYATKRVLLTDLHKSPKTHGLLIIIIILKTTSTLRVCLINDVQNNSI